MAPEAAQMEVERRLRDIGARFSSLPEPNTELLSLLEEADTWLSRVDQSPPTSISNALRPTMEALTKKGLLNHPDPGVKVAVASCLTEVTRITAPEAPYEDDVMRDVFTAIVVEAFGNLDDMDSPSFAKRVSILETVAKVRSCVLMLDLECEDLIRDTFHHFFRTISPTHQENVTSSMETIMMYVIQESEAVHPDLASCLLQNLRKEKKDSFPASLTLAEKIVNLCPEKLKPVFIQLLQGTPLNLYSETVESLVEGSSHARDDKDDASGKVTVADKKLPQTTVSDKSPQEISKSEKDVNCPGQDESHPCSTLTPSLNNGGASADNAKAPNGPASSKQKPELLSDDKQTKVSDELIHSDKEAPEPVTAEPGKLSGISSKKSRKLDTSTEYEVTERSKVPSVNQGLVASGELSPETNDGKNELALETGNRAADDKSKPVDSTPAVDKPKRGRPPAAKSQEKKPVGKSQVSGLESKEVRSRSASGGRAKDGVKLSSRRSNEEESSKNQPKDRSNLQKEDTLSDEETDEDQSLKEMVSPKSFTKMEKSKAQPGDSGGSKRKRSQEAEEVPPSKKNKVLDGSLIGSRIKVWWPDDKKFYNGVVKKFDANSKKHKVVYDDGDIEILLLKDEKWEFITHSKQDSIDDSDLPKKRGRPKVLRSTNSMSNDDSPVTSARLKVKSAEKDAGETPKAGSSLRNEGGRLSRSSSKVSNKDEAVSTKSVNRSKDVAVSKHKESSVSNPKGPSTQKASDGSKSNGLSTKRRPREKEVSSEDEEQGSAKASIGNKRRRKVLN